MSTQQTDALQCAADLEYSIARHGMQDSFTLNAYRAMKMVRTQHDRIADLEAQLEAIGAGGVSGPLIGQPQAMPDLSQLTERGSKAWAGVDAQGLREGFTAADMATAAAQGFRDGVASVRAVVAVAVTMLYETHPEDVLRVFDLCELEKISSITELLGSQQVEDIYRSAWDHLTAAPGPADGESNG